MEGHRLLLDPESHWLPLLPLAPRASGSSPFCLPSLSHPPGSPAQGDVAAVVSLLRQDVENPVLEPKKVAEENGAYTFPPRHGPCHPWGSRAQCSTSQSPGGRQAGTGREGSVTVGAGLVGGELGPPASFPEAQLSCHQLASSQAHALVFPLPESSLALPTAGPASGSQLTLLPS